LSGGILTTFRKTPRNTAVRQNVADHLQAAEHPLTDSPGMHLARRVKDSHQVQNELRTLIRAVEP
jgi:hypothetical protein